MLMEAECNNSNNILALHRAGRLLGRNEIHEHLYTIDWQVSLCAPDMAILLFLLFSH